MVKLSRFVVGRFPRCFFALARFGHQVWKVINGAKDLHGLNMSQHVKTGAASPAMAVFTNPAGWQADKTYARPDTVGQRNDNAGEWRVAECHEGRGEELGGWLLACWYFW